MAIKDEYCLLSIVIIILLFGILICAITDSYAFINVAIIIIFFAILFYLVAKAMEKLEKKEKRRKRKLREEEERYKDELEEEKEQLEIEITKLEKPYIKFFVEKYGTGDTEKKEELLELLEAKGLRMKTSHLYYFIKKEVERKEEEDFIKRVSYDNPKTIEDYCSNFLNWFGDHYRNEDLLRLERLLIDEGLYEEEAGLEQLKDTVAEIQDEKRIRSLEEKFSEKGGEYFDIQRVDSMGGFEFEGLIARLYKSMGYDVRTTPLTGDQGADLVIEKLGEKTAVQIKRSSTNIGNKAVQEIVAARNFYKCDKAIVVTNSLFTRSAEELAGSNNVKLVSRTELEELIQKYL